MGAVIRYMWYFDLARFYQSGASFILQNEECYVLHKATPTLAKSQQRNNYFVTVKEQ